MFRNILAVVAVALATVTAIEPAVAQRGDGGGRDRGGDHRGDSGGRDRSGRDGGDWDRGNRGGRGGGEWDRGGRGGGRDHDRGGRGWDRDWDDDWNWGYSSGWGYGGWGHGHHYRDDDWWVGLALGSALLDYALTPDTYYGGSSYSYGDAYAGYPTQAPNAWGLRPNQCRWDREFGYWYNRPADVEVQRCADGYGSVYVVQGSHRFLQYR